MVTPTLARRALVAALLLAAAAGCQAEVQHGLSESEANNILVVLERSGIAAQKLKEEGGREITWAVAVPKGSAARATELLVANNLPPPRQPGLEMFNEGGMIPTATEEKAKLLEAQQGELSRTIASIDGVLTARVHLNIPEQTDLDDRSKPPVPTASVLVKYRVSQGQDPKPPASAQQVQELVAHAVDGLKPESVTVIFDPATLPGGEAPGEQFVDILGLSVKADSLGTFKTLAAAVVLTILGLVVWIALLYTRSQGAPHRPSRPSPRASPEA